MKLQFPFSIGVLVAGFGTLGCGVSDAEIPSRSWWDSGATVNDAGTSDAATAADGGGSDGSVYGNEDGSTQHQAGSGGDGHESGNAGTGGSSDIAYDAGGGEEPVAGSGGSEAPVAGSGGSGGGPTCPSEYTMATHIVMNVTWPATKVGPITVVAAGSGKVHLWTKSHFDENGNTASVVSRSCGSTLPMIQTTAFVGSEKLLPEIPNASWEELSMPQFNGTATKTGNSVVAKHDPALVGLTMSNPTGTWPARVDIMGVDHDSDGHTGLAAIPKADAGYSAVPLDANRSKRADRVDLAIRNVMTLNSTVVGCPETYTGTASVSKFDNHIIGCHVKGGSECSDAQKIFVDDNRTLYTVVSATFTSKRIDDDASCAQVRETVQ